MIYKRHILTLALAGGVAAAAYALHRNARQREAKLLKEDLQSWEGEGGKPALPAAHPAQGGRTVRSPLPGAGSGSINRQGLAE